jgi:hypothetical protein
MAGKTLSRLYYYYSDAVDVVRELRDASVPSADIDVITAGRDGRSSHRIAGATSRSGVAYHASEGGKLGTVLGAGLGLMAGLGMLTVEGLTPILSVGWPAATLLGSAIGAATGAGSGALLGALMREEPPPAIPTIYAEGIRRGSTLVVVRVSGSLYERAAKIMDRQQSTGQAPGRDGSRGTAWAGFDPLHEPRLVTSIGLESTIQESPMPSK